MKTMRDWLLLLRVLGAILGGCWVVVSLYNRDYCRKAARLVACVRLEVKIETSWSVCSITSIYVVLVACDSLTSEFEARQVANFMSIFNGDVGRSCASHWS